MRLRREYGCTWRSRIRRKAAPFVFLLPGLSGVLLFSVIPFVRVIVSSFRNMFSGEFTGFRNYEAVLESEAFRLAAANMLRFIGVGLPCLLALSLVLALVLTGNAWGERCKYLYLVPLAVPAATMVLIWRLFFARQGYLNGILGTHRAFLEEDSSFWILVGSYLWKNLGYTLILWMGGLKAVPKEMTDAARVDGAGGVVLFMRVTLPCLKGSAYTILIVSLLNSFQVFREAYLAGGSYPQDKIYLLPHIFNNWYTKLEFYKMAAAAVLSVLVLGGIGVCLKRLWDREEWI